MEDLDENYNISFTKIYVRVINYFLLIVYQPQATNS